MRRISSHLATRFLVPAGLFLPIAASLAADATWNNPTTGAFTTGTNWTPNAVPGSGDNAIIGNGGTAELTTGQSASVNILRVTNGAMTAADASVTTGITSNTWQSTGDLQVGGPSSTGSLTASGATTIDTGRVRIGGYNTSGGGDSANAVGTLTLAGSSSLQTAVGGGYDLWVGNGAGSSGTLNMSGTSQLTVNSSMTSGRAGGSGTLNLSGSSTFTVSTSANIGEGGTANWTVSDNASASTGGNLILGGTSSTLTVEDSASLNVGGEFQIGNGSGNVGNVIFSGGTITANSWASIGRQSGTGSVTMSGDAVFTKTGGGNLIVGDGTTGTMTVSGNASVISNGDVWVGLNGGGIGTLTISGGSSQINGAVIVARDNAGAQGVLNLNGGTLTANAIQKGSGNGTANFNGGTFRAGQNGADILSGFASGNLTLQAGGLTVDTNGHNVSASSLLSGIGGITKAGGGELLLLGASTYTGTTTILAGSLALGASGVIADASAVTLAGGTLNLNNFSETLAALTLGSTSTIDFGSAAGANAVNFAASNALGWSGSLVLTNFEVGIDTLNFSSGSGLTLAQLDAISLFGYTATGLAGNGDVIFTAVPEPGHYALGCLLVLTLAIVARRRQRVV